MLKHISFGDEPKQLAILLPERDLNKESLLKYYIEHLENLGISREGIIAFSLDQNQKGKSPVAIMNPCLDQLGQVLDHMKIKTVMCCDSTYFKKLACVTKVEKCYGYPMPITRPPWQNIKCFVNLNYKALFFNPTQSKKIALVLRSLSGYLLKTGTVFGKKVKIDRYYPETDREIAVAIKELHKEPALTCDIEAYSLKVNKAGLGTITFCKNEKSGIAFPIGKNRFTRQQLIKFFSKYKGKLIYHDCTYDCKIIIWELFMKHSRDYKGMLKGLHLMFNNMEDTKILAYLAYNTTAGISLKLKDLAFEYLGDWGVDVTDITKIPPKELLEYNLDDGVATWYVYNKCKPIVEEVQKEVYKEVFHPSLKTITQMELCGVPLNMGQVILAGETMDDVRRIHTEALRTHPIVMRFNDIYRDKLAENATAKLKKLVKTRDDFLHMEFNPNSNSQISHMLHTWLNLPVLGTTPTGQPSTGNKVLTSLKERLTNTGGDPAHIKVIEHLIELAEVAIILNTFIPAFKENSINKDGWWWLHGSFNLGGTKSGRLSSSGPNLMNTPATGTKYAKTIKECFQPPPRTTEDKFGWLMVGADYNSLEDMISALQTKDPNKLKIYTDGYDGHCLRAYSYFGDKMPDIDPNSVKSINSIAQKYPDIRQLSKSPTFLLTYFGTWRGLMKQFGFTKEAAVAIEKNYHELYKISDEWVWKQIVKANKTGYVELAFGLRLRTPMLPQVIIESHDLLPFAAHKELKTAGNALGQSYGLLNSRAANDFMQRVWDSKYAERILPSMQIHDSQYYIIENSLGCLKFVNDNLIDAMQWNKLPAIQHPTVKLGAKLEVYYPNWGHNIVLPNYASRKELKQLLCNI